MSKINGEIKKINNAIFTNLKESCSNKSNIKEADNYKRYKVSFYVDTDQMNNMDIEERTEEILKGSGLASAIDDINVELIEELGESMNEDNIGNISLDENGYPKLESPYYMYEDNEGETLYIKSRHPYDLSDYSIAIQKDYNWNRIWQVYNENGSLAGTAEGYEEAVELMKELDSKIKPNIDRT